MNICPFKKFKNALGVPNRGVHKFHILGTAMFDYLLTIMMAFLSSYFFTRSFGVVYYCMVYNGNLQPYIIWCKDGCFTRFGYSLLKIARAD